MIFQENVGLERMVMCNTTEVEKQHLVLTNVMKNAIVMIHSVLGPI